MYQQQTTFENIVGKGEIAQNEQFLLFPQCFELNQITVYTFVHIFEIISVFAFKLEQPKIGLSGKGLIHLTARKTFHQTIPNLKKGAFGKRRKCCLTGFSLFSNLFSTIPQTNLNLLFTLYQRYFSYVVATVHKSMFHGLFLNSTQPLHYLVGLPGWLSGERVRIMTWWLRVRSPVKVNFLFGIFSLLTSAKACEKSSRWLLKEKLC